MGRANVRFGQDARMRILRGATDLAEAVRVNDPFAHDNGRDQERQEEVPSPVNHFLVALDGKPATNLEHQKPRRHLTAVCVQPSHH